MINEMRQSGLIELWHIIIHSAVGCANHSENQLRSSSSPYSSQYSFIVFGRLTLYGVLMSVYVCIQMRIH